MSTSYSHSPRSRAETGAARRKTLFRIAGALDSLEPRWLPSGTTAAVQMISATTTDSKSVTIDYTVSQPITGDTPVQLGIYRSSNGQLDASDPEIGTFTLTPAGASNQSATLDSNGLPATAVGTHELTIPISGGLPPVPKDPYVVVGVNTGSPAAIASPGQTASFRIYTIGVVTHGGIQDPSWTHGPPWELETAYMMRHEGYDAVIAYNWAEASSTPGSAIKQSPRLADIIANRANSFPAGAPVDLDFIGHSEGTVINTYAIVDLERIMTPGLKAGYITDTLLDPHAANDDLATGKQTSYAGIFGGLASAIVSRYQSEAKDPPAYFPTIVDQAQVFYQHSTATASAMYNLWGQVPVQTDGPLVHYFNLTAAHATHSGNTGVSLWYRNFVVPTLGNGAPLVGQLQLSGQIDNAQVVEAAPGDRRAEHINHAYGPQQVVRTDQPEFSGTAAPGSVVRLYVGPANDPATIALAGTTTADAAGDWSLTTSKPLHNGQYRTVVNAFSRALRTRPGLTVVPTQPLGRLVVKDSSAT